MSRADRVARRAARLERWRRLQERVTPGRPILLAGTLGDERVELALLDAAERGVIELIAGAITHVHLVHDHGCRAPQGRRCRCRPEVLRGGAKA